MIAWIGLGANLGDARATLARACRELDQGVTRVQALSGLWRTRPMGPPDQPEYLNAVARVASALGVRGLLARLQEIESGLGRQARPRWREREVDLDLLLAEEDGPLLAGLPGLQVPHAGLAGRAFVLAPLLEVDADLVDPRTGGRLDAALSSLMASEPDAVRRMEEPGWCRNW